MSLLSAAALPDVQAQHDSRGVALDEVGIDGFSYPLSVLRRDGAVQATVCDAELVAALVAHERGTHMSRFVEVLRDGGQAISPASPLAMARHLRERLAASASRVELRFPIFLERSAPVSGDAALMRFGCAYGATSADAQEGVGIGVEVPVTSLCPCSKDISDYGAHSQRGYLRIEVTDTAWAAGEVGVWPEELIETAEAAASAPIYPLLKRVDERELTMAAYDKPAFVEDLVRDVAVALRDDARVHAFVVEAANEESIHDHRAVARLRWSRT